MTKLQGVARAILESDGWISTKSIAEIVDMEQKMVAAYTANLRNLRLIESEAIDGQKALRHRTKDRAGLEGYTAQDRIQGRKIDTDQPTRAARVATPTPTPAPAALDGELQRPGLSWAIDQSGRLLISFGTAAYELRPAQWTPLAKFLNPLAEQFA